MFERPYYYQPYQAYNGYEKFHQGNAYHQEWHYPPIPQTHPAYFQTPFEQFSKPEQPANWPANMQANNASLPPAKSNGLFSYFQNKDGQVDLDKMFSTVGQFANTVQQISPVVKQVGSIMKNL